jgi:tetratricopeptide (TPR) repeat protein
MLLGPVTGHLEKATAFLNGSMQPSQRQRLESIVADTAVFVGVLSRQSSKLAQARAYLGLAEELARQARNLPLLAQVYAQQALLDYYSQAPDGKHGDPRNRVALLEQADKLAARSAPAIVQMATSAWLAEDRAAANDGYGADHALERASQAIVQTQAEGQVGTDFCSTAGKYCGWGEGDLRGFKGAVELALNRPQAIRTLGTSVQLKTNPRGQATALTYLAIALMGQKQPDEASACLIKAHTIGLSYSSATILHHVLSARAMMPPEWNSLRNVRELDERLRVG